MAVDQRRRQKKLEKRKAKRELKRRELSRQGQMGMADCLAAAATAPILDCWVSPSIGPNGLGYVVISRKLRDGSVAFSSFLVDRYCLGVKDAMADIVSRSTYDEKVERRLRARFGAEKLNPEDARKLVEDAVKYADDLGFRPHPDYHIAKHIFGDIDVAASTQEFEFGKDGKPLFIPGPYDSPSGIANIMSKLTASVGVGNLGFLVPMSPSDEFDYEPSEEDEPFVPDSGGILYLK